MPTSPPVRAAAPRPPAEPTPDRPWTLGATYVAPARADYARDLNWFRVRAEGLRFDCLTRIREGSDRLVVVLNGAVNRSTRPLPQFARWNWAPLLNAHLLCVSDPTLTFDDLLALGWFLGRKDRDATTGLVEIARACAKQLGVPMERVIFYGSSGGGFAAMQAAARLPAGRAVAVNAQVDVGLYSMPKGRLAEVFDPEASFEESQARFPTRFNATLAVEQALAQGRRPRIVYGQNLQDVRHHDGHFIPFAERFGAPLGGGDNAEGWLRTMIYDAENGHGPETTPVAREIATSGFEFLLR